MEKIIGWLVTLPLMTVLLNLFIVVFQYGAAVNTVDRAQQNAMWVAQIRGGVDDSVRSTLQTSLASSPELRYVSLNGTPTGTPFGDPISMNPKVTLKYTFIGVEFEENVAFDDKGISLYKQRK